MLAAASSGGPDGVEDTAGAAANNPFESNPDEEVIGE